MNPSEITSGFTLSLDHGVAETLGIDAALIYNHIIYWLRINAGKSDAEMIEEKYWMYETNKQMAEFFGFYTEDQISRGIKKLIDSGLIIKKCLSKNPFDRTSWYTVHDQSLLKKSLRNPQICGMHSHKTAESQPPKIAESDPANLRDVVYTTEEQEKNNKKQQQQQAGAFENHGTLIYKNTKGEAVSVSESDIYKHFLKLPYASEEIKKAILQVRQSSDFIGNIFKYLEAICLRIHNDKHLNTNNLHKIEDCDIPDTSNEPKVNFGEYMKKHHNIDVGRKNEKQ